MDKPDFQASLQAEVDRRVRFIIANREALVEAWVAETGLLPSESVLVERQCDDGSVEVSVRRRGVFVV